MSYQDFDCGYINKPYTNLRPFTSFSPCPRFSCPDFCRHSPCDCFPYNPNFNCKNPYLNECISPRDLLIFLGGMSAGKNCHKPTKH